MSKRLTLKEAEALAEEALEHVDKAWGIYRRIAGSKDGWYFIRNEDGCPEDRAFQQAFDVLAAVSQRAADSDAYREWLEEVGDNAADA